jgi:hypothetical protein
MAPRAIPAAIAEAELTPKISPLKPAARKANPNEPPINPTPTIPTVFMSVFYY